jgi:phosphoribosylaminoimidazole-succinocarboxamide synthase
MIVNSQPMNQIMPTPIPGKGKILTSISNFWFDYFDKFPNHRSNTSLTLNTANEHPFNKYNESGRSIPENFSNIAARIFLDASQGAYPVPRAYLYER